MPQNSMNVTLMLICITLIFHWTYPPSADVCDNAEWSADCVAVWCGEGGGGEGCQPQVTLGGSGELHSQFIIEIFTAALNQSVYMNQSINETLSSWSCDD